MNLNRSELMRYLALLIGGRVGKVLFAFQGGGMCAFLKIRIRKFCLKFSLFSLLPECMTIGFADTVRHPQT